MHSLLLIIKIHSKQMKASSFLIKIFIVVLFVTTTSCNNEDITKITAIKLQPIGGTELLINQAFQFEVIANNSDTITDVATIKIDGVVFENDNFSSATPGVFEAQAFYEGFESKVLPISTIYPTGYIKNVLIEDYTGTWCVNCPRIIHAIELAKAQSDKVVSVGIHMFDAMEMDGANVLTDEFNIAVYPTAKLNRINEWDNDVNNIEGAISYTGYGADLGLSINSDITGATIDATIQVGFNNSITTPLAIVVYLTENGLLYDQHNGTEYFGGVDPLVDFEHNDVLRAFYTHYLGEVIPSSEAVADNIYEFTIQKPIPTSVQNNEKLHLVAFVTNANTKEVLNVREVKVGIAQELQKLD